MDHIRVGRNMKITQSMLEDVVEAIAGAILLELGYSALYKWTLLALGPMVEDYKRALCGEFGGSVQGPADYLFTLTITSPPDTTAWNEGSMRFP